MASPSFEFDICARTLTLAGEDVTTRTFALPPGMFDFETNLERVAVRLDPPELTVGLPNGRHAVVELSDPRRSLEELRAGRPCVYLDQNHWSMIAAAREGRGSITVEQARAAEVLVGLVEDRRILLPVSGGHLVESTPLYGDRRVALATTVLQLGRGWRMRNPLRVRAEEILRSPHRRVRFLHPAELDELIDAVPEDTLGAVERTLYLAAALTGLRQGELLALKWLDIDWQVGRVRVADNFTRGRMDTPKSHEGRSVPMAARLARELGALHQRSRYEGDGDLVFCHPETGHVLDPSKMRKRFKDALACAGVREITFHELRHTFGTQMAAAGAPLRAIQEWMGHADAKTTEIYRHYAPDPTHGAAFVDRAFGSGQGSGADVGDQYAPRPDA